MNHHRDDIPILPYKKPNILVVSMIRPYKALQLANSATQYFSRPEAEMDHEQHGALKNIREYINAGLIANLGSPDARVILPADDMNTLCTHLMSVFFFGRHFR